VVATELADQGAGSSRRRLLLPNYYQAPDRAILKAMFPLVKP
jgi:hypothetical protein